MESLKSGNDEPIDVRCGLATETELEAISDLIQRMSKDPQQVRLRDKSAAYYRWMYLQNPAGPAVVSSAWCNGTLVASFAIAPKMFQIAGELTLVGKTMDMFTDPNFQGRGLIGRCTAAAFPKAREVGMAGWYVTPSVNSYPIFKEKWGYPEPFRLVYRARLLRFEPVLGAVSTATRIPARILDAVRSPWHPRGPRLEAGDEVVRVTQFDRQVDDLWERVRAGYQVAIVRDAEYLRWRYLDNPDTYTILGLRRAGGLVGLVVLGETLRRGVRCGEVLDVVCGADDEATFDLLMDAAIEHSWRAGHGLIQTWSVHGTALDARIKRSGLRVLRTDVKFLVSPDFPSPLVHDPEAWLLTQGDGNDV